MVVFQMHVFLYFLEYDYECGVYFYCKLHYYLNKKREIARSLILKMVFVNIYDTWKHVACYFCVFFIDRRSYGGKSCKVISVFCTQFESFHVHLMISLFIFTTKYTQNRMP